MLKKSKKKNLEEENNCIRKEVKQRGEKTTFAKFNGVYSLATLSPPPSSETNWRRRKKKASLGPSFLPSSSTFPYPYFMTYFLTIY